MIFSVVTVLAGQESSVSQTERERAESVSVNITKWRLSRHRGKLRRMEFIS